MKKTTTKRIKSINHVEEKKNTNKEKDDKPGKSCLLASISTGTPALSGLLAVRVSSILASSNLSPSQESTTNIMPSVQRV